MVSDIIIDKEKYDAIVEDMEEMKVEFDKAMSEVPDFDEDNPDDIMVGMDNFISNLMFKTVEKKDGTT